MIELKNKYIAYLEKHRSSFISDEALFFKPYQILRENYSDKVLRIDGVFFSSLRIADRLIYMLGTLNPLDSVVDPCCGIGDLLLAYTKKLPHESEPEKIIQSWTNLLYGNDINKDFVDVTKLRFVLNAFYLCNKKYTIGDALDSWEGFCFPHLTSGNAMNMDIGGIKTILLNPPFQQEVTNKEYAWSSGKISMAAVFLYELYQKNKAAQFAVILPDVIRSGTRYQKLRNDLSAFNWKKAKVYGRFDKQTDVDVFLITNQSNETTSTGLKKDIDTMSKFFEVHVGPVVPHRDPMEGKEHYYLTAKNTPRGTELRQFEKKIQSLKQAFKGPFLVIKRTSSPSDTVRCATTFINSKNYFFVENHLIILLPRDKTVETCRKAMIFLNSDECNKLINKAIRCRHLTVSSINNLPFKKEKNNG